MLMGYEPRMKRLLPLSFHFMRSISEMPTRETADVTIGVCRFSDMAHMITGQHT